MDTVFRQRASIEMVDSTDEKFEQPYPLRRLFRSRALPAFGVAILVLGLLAGFGGIHLVQTIYLELAERRAAVIDRAVRHEAPGAWMSLAAGAAPSEVYSSPEGWTLLRILEDEVKELSLLHLKIYNDKGIVIFSSESENIGIEDRSAAFVRAIDAGERTVVHKVGGDGQELYELYVIYDIGNGHRVVFELYEPISSLNSILLRSVLPAVLVPGGLLLVLALGLGSLVGRAQADIDGRAKLLAELRGRLEKFVSGSAISAARQAVGGDRVLSKKTTCTLLYSDIRDFTGYAETKSPEEVVAFLNRMMSIQVAAVTAAGGDVDKMIGDALLARFEGPERETAAIRAARRIIVEIAAAALPRGVGIGVYTGEVISGAIGPDDRMDFTVIGDSVNTSARLCSAAGGGEIVADVGTVAAAGEPDFGSPEEIAVKGRRASVGVRRWSVSRPTPL